MAEEKPPRSKPGDTTLFWRKVVKRRTAKWLHGLVGAFVSGGATVVTTEGGLLMGHAMGMSVETLAPRQIGMVFLSSGIAGAVLYLKQSPIPSIQHKILEGDTDFPKPPEQ